MLLKPVKSEAHEVITHDGYSYTLRDWAEFLDIPYDTLRMRYRRGLIGDELFKQVRGYRPRKPPTLPN
jgi:DNA-directed RNA polymerase specialized sigma24 family protein